MTLSTQLRTFLSLASAQLRKICGSHYSPLAWFRAWRSAGLLIKDGDTSVEVDFEDVL